LTHKRKEGFVKMLSEIDIVFKMLGNEVLTRIYDMEANESGLTFYRIKRADLELFYYNRDLVHHEPMVLQSGKGWQELPEWIRNSKSILNIQNNDDSCFKWCVTRYFFQENGINYSVTKELKKEAENFKCFGQDNPKTFNEENFCKFEGLYNVRIIIFNIGDEPGYKIMHMRRDKDNYDKKIYIRHYIDHFFIIRNIKGFI
jgi:hypothetical protein